MTNESESLDKKIKLLLVEDNDEHVDASRFPINVEPTRVRTYVEALSELYGSEDAHDKTRYFNVPNPNGYDIMLTDINFPMGNGVITNNTSRGVLNHSLEIFTNEGKRKIEDQDLSAHLEVEPYPLGWPLILVAIQVGIRYIGMYTDTNHHTGIMPASLDAVTKQKQMLGDTTIALWDIRSEVIDPNDGFWKELMNSLPGTIHHDDRSQVVVSRYGLEKDPKHYERLLSYLLS